MPHSYLKAAINLTVFLFLSTLPHAQTLLCDSSFALYRQDVLYEMDHYKGRVRWDPETRESYYMVMAYFPTEALVRFTDDSIPAIRADTFTGLAQMNTPDSILLEIFNKHRNDTAEFCGRSSSNGFCHLFNEYMKMVLEGKADSNVSTVDFQAHLHKLRNSLRVVVPGARFGEVAKDSLLTMDSLVCPVPGCRIVSFQFYTKRNIQRQEQSNR